MITMSSDGAVDKQLRLYEGHEPVTLFQRSLLAAGSAVMGLIQPTRSGQPTNVSMIIIASLC